MQRAQSANWYDVVAFLTVASLLGLFVGVVLGAVALLLAGPARNFEMPIPAAQAAALRAGYQPAAEEEEPEAESAGADIVLPACEGQAPRPAPRRLEM